MVVTILLSCVLIVIYAVVPLAMFLGLITLYCHLRGKTL